MAERESVAAILAKLQTHTHLSTARVCDLLSVLRRRTGKGAAVRELVVAGGLTLLLKMLSVALPAHLLSSVLSVVGNCSVHPCARRHFLQCGGVKTIVNILSAVDDVRIAVRAFRTLANLCKHAELCSAIHQLGVLQLSLNMLGTEPGAISREKLPLLTTVVRLWRNLCHSRGEIGDLVRSGCFPVVLQCLMHEDRQLLAESLRTATHCARTLGAQVASQILKTPAVLARVTRLCGVWECVCSSTLSCKSSAELFDPDLSGHALPLLLALCCQSSARPDLTRLGVMQLLYTAAALDLTPLTDPMPYHLPVAEVQEEGLPPTSSASRLSQVHVASSVSQTISRSKLIDRASLISCLCMFAWEPASRVRMRSLGILVGLVNLLTEACRPETSTPTCWGDTERGVLHALYQFVYDDWSMAVMKEAGLMTVLVIRLESYVEGDDGGESASFVSGSDQSDAETDLYCVNSPTYRQGRGELRQYEQRVHELTGATSPTCLSTGSSPSSGVWSPVRTASLSPSSSSGNTPSSGSVSHEHDWVLMLLARESQSSSPHPALSSTRLLHALTRFCRSVATDSQRAPRILARLARNPSCFHRLVTARLPSLVSVQLSRQVASVVISSLSSVAETSYGLAELESLLKSDQLERSTSGVLAICYTVRSVLHLHRLMLKSRGLSVLVTLLRKPDPESVERKTVLDACVALFRSLSIQAPPSSAPGIEDPAAKCRVTGSVAASDVTLVADDGEVGAVREQLASGSAVMAALLTGHFREAASSHVPVPGVNRALLEALVHAVYGCGVGGGTDCLVLSPLSASLWLDLLVLCDRFLLTACADQLSARVLTARRGEQLLQLYRRSRELQLTAESGQHLHVLMLARLASCPGGSRHLQQALTTDPHSLIDDIEHVVTVLLRPQTS